MYTICTQCACGTIEVGCRNEALMLMGRVIGHPLDGPVLARQLPQYRINTLVTSANEKAGCDTSLI